MRRELFKRPVEAYVLAMPPGTKDGDRNVRAANWPEVLATQLQGAAGHERELVIERIVRFTASSPPAARERAFEFLGVSPEEVRRVTKGLVARVKAGARLPTD